MAVKAAVVASPQFHQLLFDELEPELQRAGQKGEAEGQRGRGAGGQEAEGPWGSKAERK